MIWNILYPKTTKYLQDCKAFLKHNAIYAPTLLKKMGWMHQATPLETAPANASPTGPAERGLLALPAGASPAVG
jgi:hypothetical protein